MASSSSNPQRIYDVFISFRGEDVRRNFLSHLYAALSKASIIVFVDDDELRQGTKLGPELLGEIGSQISLVVFSENYAGSSWCLDELVKIMECHETHGQKVIPIFYDVDPWIVRHQEGAFGEALEATAKRRCSDGEMQHVLSRWRSALKEAADMRGFIPTRHDWYDGELVKNIVEAVLKILEPDKTLLSIPIPEFAVGLESRTDEVIKFIQNQASKICVVGIWGMGRSGKTTIANAIYNQIYRKFVDRSFIKNIREVCEKDNAGIIHLQEQLLSDVLKSLVKIDSIATGATEIGEGLRRKRVLVVLDDVDKFEQLEALCGNRKWFGSGSVVIITTRDEQLLKSLEVDYYVCTSPREESVNVVSSSNPQWIHDVFINFRGEDTRKTFVSHLDAALSDASINAFIDDRLDRGTEVGPELERAIEWSQISLVIFSQNYVGSSWCLNELLKIMECHRTYRQVVIPIFYCVDPSMVRHQTGAFGEALEATAKNRRPDGEMLDVLPRWRSSLTDAANLSGRDSSTFRNDAELVRKIVEDVWKQLDNTLLSNPKVGLESRVQNAIEFIEKQSNIVCTVGIWGIGGSGKTTLAKAICNQIHRNFECISFIENIREVCERDSGGHIHLQQQLLLDVLKTKEKVHSVAFGTNLIQKRLSGKRALIVLDDVTTFDQVKALCGSCKCFGSGSVLIVTTRDVRILNLLKVGCVYRMKEMDKNESLELFSWHALREPSPIGNFSELSKKVVAYCGGLPLALEVIGSYLYERTKQEWKSVLSKLERIPNDQVQEKLRISYDGLKDDMEKDTFLDICCFFIGKDKAYVTEILNGCGLHADIGITVLIERSLLKVEKNNNKLRMHVLLRDMGREIVRQRSAKEPGKRCRLWLEEDVCDVLTKNTGTETIEGLVLKLQRTSKVCLRTDSFKEMKKLRLLQLDRADLTGDFGYLSEQLRWVNWQGFTFKCIPDDFYQENLVVIDLKYSNIKQVWKETKLLEKLKILNLSHSGYLRNTPDFSKLPNLEKLIMKDCPSLSEVHQSIGDLSNLLLINLKDCTSLSNLPRKIYQSKSVTTLIISGCSKIDKLEEDIVQMDSLTTLIANDTAIKKVPYSIVISKSIGYISLCGYEGLSRDVFPSLIWSWMSPTMNSLQHIPPFGGLSLVSLDVESNNLCRGHLLPMPSALSKLRSVRVHCNSEIQITQELGRFLGDLYDANFTKLETSHATPITDLSLRSLLIRMGSCHRVIDTLGKSISEGLKTNDSCDSFLPGDNYPSWLAYTCEGSSVLFQVPEDSDYGMRGIILCVVYSSTSDNIAGECLTSVVIINYTKCTIQIFKRDTAMFFNDEDWQGVISNLGVGDNVEIFVAFGHGLTVKETAIYIIYDYGQSMTMQIEPSTTMEVEPSTDVKMEPSPEVNVQSSPNVKSVRSPEEEVQPSPEVNVQSSPNVKSEPSPEEELQPSPEVSVQSSPNVKSEPSPEEEVQPSPNAKMELSPNVKTEPLPKPNKKIFTRLANRVGECLCLNQSRGFNNF